VILLTTSVFLPVDSDDDDNDDGDSYEQSMQIRNVDDALVSFSFHNTSNRRFRSPD
jgi:hypothetical protein